MVRQGLRLLVGLPLAWWVFAALMAPELPKVTALGAVAIGGATLWNPIAGLALTAGLTPAAALLAPPPARPAEMFAWAFLAVWLLAIWRPLTQSGTETPRQVTAPAALFAAALAASWLMLTIGDAAGVALPALPQFVAHALPTDHLVFSSPEPHTWTLLQSVTGLALMAAACVSTQNNPRFAPIVGWTLVTAAGMLALATVADVIRQWAEVGYGGWFLLRYVRGERFSLHLADLNAAGSLYVLAGSVAASVALFDRSRRGRAVMALVLMGPALMLTGSRTSFAAAVAAVLIVAVTQQRRPLTRPQAVTAITSLAILVMAGAATVDWQSDVRGSAAQSASLRSQFMATSARMFASAPVAGVGIGRYFDRSAEFMSSELRAIYGNENAHNYFVQQFAELGVVGGILFVWLAFAVVATGWLAARRSQDPLLLGLFGGVTAYLVTCFTGHPLLVPEAAFPFWIAAGALTGAIAPGTAVRSAFTHVPRLAVSAAICVIVAAGVARGAMNQARADVTPADYGFHEQETAADGTTYRWMTRHAVAYMPGDGTGFVRLRLRAPDRSMARPLTVETAVGGNVVDRREIPQGRWITYDVPSRTPVSGSFQRIDLRTNEWWMQDVQLGRRLARRPIAVMVAEVRWIPVDEIR